MSFERNGAFDQSTRGRLQKLVNSCRSLLSDEFSIQLQQTYGLDPKTGEVTPMARLTHLDDRQRHTAEVLRQTLAHYLGADADDTDHRIAVIDRMVREQAFTVLNRLAALLMMEARGQLIESVSKGYQSRGYQLYSKIAGTALGETGQAYQIYLFSMFDELTQELPMLFDRYAANGLLFPRETALRALLEELNHFEIEPLWAEDETVGWIYQYFNSKEERKKLRDARAPRNSRELAVRNQFFTPRYVVELLVDNTLGRFWYNSTGGKTELTNRCTYLAIQPHAKPIAKDSVRDPRTIKLLDPACGSMHFGLYAFDLFLEIYRESWDWELQYGPGSLDVSTSSSLALKPLTHEYLDQSAFLLDVPRLIIKYNIFGVDIDPRAAQIASLALWLRAQRAWHEGKIKAKDRPLIDKGNVISAIAPPAERKLLTNFQASLDGLDSQLFERVLQLLKGLPELGVLLKTERELPHLIRQVFVGGRMVDLFAAEEKDTWEKAETRLRKSLNEFAQVAGSTYQGHLYVQDALEVLRLIDLTSNKFDVIVMNPPFGEAAQGTKAYIDSTYSASKGNLLTNFIERAADLLRKGGQLGAIVSRSGFYLKSFSNFRRDVLATKYCLETFSDFGQGVLDALVETAAVTWSNSPDPTKEAVFFRHLMSQNKSADLFNSIQNFRAGRNDSSTFIVAPEKFSLLDDLPYVYWLPKEVIENFSRLPRVDPKGCDIRVGLQTNDDFRFLRLWFEVMSDQIVSIEPNNKENSVQQNCIRQTANGRHWAWYSKTDKSSAFQASIHMLVNWRHNGSEVKAFIEGKGHVASKHVMSEDRYFQPGFSYMLRATRLVPYVVPIGVIPTAGRSQVYPKPELVDWMLILMGSNIATCVARFRGEKFSHPKFQNSMVGAVPYLEFDKDILKAGLSAIEKERTRVSSKLSTDDTEILFFSPSKIDVLKAEADSGRRSLLGDELERQIAAAYGLNIGDFEMLQRDLLEALNAKDELDFDDIESSEEVSANLDDEPTTRLYSILSYAVGCAFGRWDIRNVIDNKQSDVSENPFAPLPAIPPGMLPPSERLEIIKNNFDTYPITFGPYGILVEDTANPQDITSLVSKVLRLIQPQEATDFESSLFQELGAKTLRDYLSRPAQFFANHLKSYTKSRRKAPIYWPLSTASCTYTIWIYYPSLNNQTLFTAVNDFIDGPNGKLTQVSRECAEMRVKGSGRTHDEEKQYEVLQTFEQELIDFRENLLKIAPVYQPNHDDGVQITAAPLWPLFRHKPWQKVLKDTWSKLGKGDYDWAHLAMAYWPERVREKCKTDKSLAIAHGLEDLYVEPEVAPRKTRGKKKAGADE